MSYYPMRKIEEFLPHQARIGARTPVVDRLLPAAFTGSSGHFLCRIGLEMGFLWRVMYIYCQVKI